MGPGVGRPGDGDEVMAARSMLEKLRDFAVRDLGPAERAALAALLAPGVALAYPDPEVEGFGLPGWSPTDLPDSLVRAVRQVELRIVARED